MTDKCQVSVVVPVCNEVENIEKLVNEIQDSLLKTGKTYEIIVVDDGSRDGTRDLLPKLAQQIPELKVILFRRNYGQTAAMDAGFKNLRGEIVVTMDGDLQNDPADIQKMLAKMDEGYDFVAGWRKHRKDGFVLRTFPSKIANFIIRKVTRTTIKDLGCSLKVYKRDIVDELNLYGEMHRFIGVLVEDLGAKCVQVEVNHRARVAGESKYNLNRVVKVLIDLTTVWFFKRYLTKPSYVFTSYAGLLVASGLGISAWVLYERVVNHIFVHNNPWFIVAIFLFLLGSQFIAFGLMAEIVIRNHFESTQRRPYSVYKRYGFN